MQFRKSLAKYYHKWYQDCLNSAEYCRIKEDYEGAKQYLSHASQYEYLIEVNKDLIEFFSIGDRAFLVDSALPVEFRNKD